MDTGLVAITKLMDLTSDTEEEATFECLGEERSYGVLLLPRDEWVELDCPQQITVTIEPGNELEDVQE
jgi:hypothetical protein